MNKEKYDKNVLEQRISFVSEQEAKHRAQADVYETSAKRRLKILSEMSLDPKEREAADKEIDSMMGLVRENRAEADALNTLASALCAPDKPKEAQPEYTLEDVAFTIHNAGHLMAGKNPNYDALVNCFTVAAEALRRARDLIAQVPWPSPGDTQVMAALAVLDKITGKETQH